MVAGPSQRRNRTRKVVPEADETSAISDPRVQIAGDANFGRWRRTVTQWRRWEVAVRESSSNSSKSESSDDEAQSPLDISDGDIDADSSTPVLNGAPAGVKSLRGGLRTCAPGLYAWLMARLGTRSKFLLVLLFIVVDSAKFMTSEWIDPQRELRPRDEEVNVLSIVVVTDLLSLSIGLVTAYVLEGRRATEKIFNWHSLWRFLLISCFFSLSTMCLYYSYDAGASVAAVATIGNSYLPIAAAFSFVVMKRMYGKLEWLSLCIITFAVMTFILLRQRGLQKKRNIIEDCSSSAVMFILFSVVLGVVASILSERIYKERSFGIIRANQGQRHDRFYIYKIHMDFSACVVSACLWVMPTGYLHPFLPSRNSDIWFGPWGASQVVMIIVAIAQAWLAGIVTKHFSTVIKSVAQTMTSVLVILVLDPLVLGSWTFDGGSMGQIAKVLLAIIIVFSAFIFQTGRLLIRELKKQMNIKKPLVYSVPTTKSGLRRLGWWASIKALVVPPRWEARQRAEDKFEANMDELSHAETSTTDTSDEDGVCDSSSGGASPAQQLLSAGIMYSSMTFFILADSGRTLSQQAAQSKTMITPISMVLACFICGVAIAAGLAMYSDGVQGLKLAFHPLRTLRALPCAAFFALSSTLLSLAYAQGINAALATVLGYIYMPFSALASRWVLGKYYMWLEWFALIILTMACAVFGVLQQYYEHEGEQQREGGGVMPMMLVLFSAISSVFGSLVAEKILKEESLPFHIQKVRLDMGSTITTLALLPIIGAISSRPKDAFWKERPLDMQCMWLTPECTEKILLTAPNSSFGCANPICAETCGCGSGLFVGWNDGMVLFALVLNVVQGWLGGKVAKQFSTVMRAIAQSLSLIVIYVVGDMLVSQKSVHDLSMTFMALIVPLSTCIFLVAVGEMEKVMRLSEKSAGSSQGPQASMLRLGASSSGAAGSRLPTVEDDL
eukprot:TRINITY_DN21174_c0_g3_i1.p1 TRINITY_DN21174_c0_g3~~TRINITY_DN21174_c0_g3_i1.p1  ORF type:complete len:979 (-),score=203.75 TRINITY_DN21174_c0_g3_i1:69-2927(-)